MPTKRSTASARLPSWPSRPRHWAIRWCPSQRRDNDRPSGRADPPITPSRPCTATCRKGCGAGLCPNPTTTNPTPQPWLSSGDSSCQHTSHPPPESLTSRGSSLGGMRFMSMWSIIITSAIIRARAMACSFHYPAQQAWMTAQCSVVNGLADCSNTTSARPHEFFDHTSAHMLALRQPVGVVALAPRCSSPYPLPLSCCLPKESCSPVGPVGAGTRIAFPIGA